MGASEEATLSEQDGLESKKENINFEWHGKQISIVISENYKASLEMEFVALDIFSTGKSNYCKPKVSV